MNRFVFWTVFITSVFALNMPEYSSVDPDLVPYIQKVAELSEGNLKGIKRAGFGEDDDNTLGRCNPLWNEIKINTKNWKNLNYRGKILLIAHELGHCVKGCGHIDSYDKNGCASHFMNSTSTTKLCEKIKWNEYIKQMKNLNC